MLVVQKYLNLALRLSVYCRVKKTKWKCLRNAFSQWRNKSSIFQISTCLVSKGISHSLFSKWVLASAFRPTYFLRWMLMLFLIQIIQNSILIVRSISQTMWELKTRWCYGMWQYGETWTRRHVWSLGCSLYLLSSTLCSLSTIVSSRTSTNFLIR